jgi:hypothetical protein
VVERLKGKASLHGAVFRSVAAALRNETTPGVGKGANVGGTPRQGPPIMMSEQEKREDPPHTGAVTDEVSDEEWSFSCCGVDRSITQSIPEMNNRDAIKCKAMEWKCKVCVP